MNDPKNKIQCAKCKGSGFLQYNPIICSTCHGIKCIMCNSTGLERMPWDLCNVCNGDGEVKS